MDLHDVIKKATLLPSADNAKFYRLQDLSQAEKDRKMNERIVKIPKNLMLLENDIDQGDNSIKENDVNKTSPSFDRHRIQAAIKEVTGGLEQSNEHWKKYWIEHLEDRMKNNMKKSCESSLHKDTEENSGNQYEAKNLKHQLIKEKNKIFRNAAIMGLVNTNKISLEDLADFNDKNFIKEERLKTLVKNTQTDDAYQVEFVPLREDPEIFVHPLRMGIDVTKYKNLDFTVPSVGKKIKETPQEYFLRTTTDDSFEFVRKNKNTV